MVHDSEILFKLYNKQSPKTRFKKSLFQDPKPVHYKAALSVVDVVLKQQEEAQEKLTPLCDTKAFYALEVTLLSQPFFKDFGICDCMGTVEAGPEPLINHLRKGLDQLWEHR